MFQGGRGIIYVQYHVQSNRVQVSSILMMTQASCNPATPCLCYATVSANVISVTLH